jgi:hypothetical protein
MNICFLALDYPSSAGGGGVGNQVRTMGRFLTKAAHQTTVVSFAEGGSPSYEDDGGIQVHRVRLGNVHWYMSKMPWMGPIAASAIRELEQAWAVYTVMRRLQRHQTFDVVEGTEHGSLLVALLMKL